MIDTIDEMLSSLGRRQLVLTTEVVDMLLDLRNRASEDATIKDMIEGLKKNDQG